MNKRVKRFVGKALRFVLRGVCLPMIGEAGSPFWYRPSEYPRLLFGHRWFEASKRKEWAALLQPGEVILDIGANIGLTAHRFYSLLKGRCTIWCFEPVPRNLQLLRKNCHCIRDRTQIMGVALGAENREVTFRDNLEHGALSRLASLDATKPPNPMMWDSAKEIVVQQITLDSFMKSHPELSPTFLKIDVEGAGGQVVAGGADLFKRFRPFVECSMHSKEEQQTVCALLAEAGYHGLHLVGGAYERIELHKASIFAHADDKRLGLPRSV